MFPVGVINVEQKDATCDVRAFCREAGLYLNVSPELKGKEFDSARNRALLHACRAWNMLDKSGKHRIKLPAGTDGLKIQMECHPDSDSDETSSE